MRKRAELLIRLIAVELDELVEDVKDLEAVYAERFARSEISNYVYQENNAMLEKEIRCIDKLKTRLDGFLGTSAETIEALAAMIEADFRQELRADSSPDALWPLVARRIAKALRYCVSKE